MTQPQYVDLVIKILSGSGVRTDEMQGRGENFIGEIINSCRGEALNLLAQKGGGVAAIFYQESYFTEADMKDEGDCIQRFFAPAPLYKMSGEPWVEWIGGKDWSRNTKFRVANSRSALVEMNAHHVVGRKQLVRAYYDNAAGCFWIYRNKGAVNFALRQIFADPTQCKEYNIDKDPYPYPTDQNDLLMDLILQRYFKTLQGGVDATSNSRNDAQIIPRRQG
jgi:hypothetical protein